MLLALLVTVTLISCDQASTVNRINPDEDENLIRYLPYSRSVYDGNGTIYAFDSVNILSIDIDTRRITKIANVPSNILTVEYNENKLVFADGYTVWQYSIETRTLEKIQSYTYQIAAIYLARGYAIIKLNDNSTNNCSLIRLSDNKTVDSYFCWNNAGGKYAFCQSKDRIFYLDKISPNLYYIDIDFINEKIVASGESPDNGKYVLGFNLKLSPDEAIILGDYGYLYDANSLLMKANINSRFIDFAFYKDEIGGINIDNEVVIYSVQNPSQLIKEIKTYSNKISPEYFIIHNNKAYVVYHNSHACLGIEELPLD